MLIRCPDCTFTRQVNEDKIPASSEFATCPKCQKRFRFRTAPVNAMDPQPESATDLKEQGKAATEKDTRVPSRTSEAATPKKDGDIWDAVENLNDRWDSREKSENPAQADSRETSDAPGSTGQESARHAQDTPDVPDIPHKPAAATRDKKNEEDNEGPENTRRAARGYQQLGQHEQGEPQRPATEDSSEAPRRPSFLANQGSVPWEYSGGFMNPQGLIRTMILSMSRIPEFFSGLPAKGSLLPAMIFALLMNVPLLAIIAFGTLTMQNADGEAVSVSIAELEGFSMSKMILAFLFLIILTQFINAWLVNFIAKLVTKRSNFSIAFKTVSYSMTPLIFAVIPGFGLMLANIGAMTVFTLGLRHAYRLSWPHTMMILLPYLLIKGLFTAMFIGGVMG